MSHFGLDRYVRPAPARRRKASLMDFWFLIGCPVAADVTTVYADPTRRGDALAGHAAAHNAAPFVAARTHPDSSPGDPTPTFSAGDAVTFYGSTTDQEAQLVLATVTSAASGTDQDGIGVDGYLLTAPEDDGLTTAASLHAA